MSSRLFQRVREELGLAYSVFAYKSFYLTAGHLGVYVGTQTGQRGEGGRGDPRGVRPAGPGGSAGGGAGQR